MGIIILVGFAGIIGGGIYSQLPKKTTNWQPPPTKVWVVIKKRKTNLKRKCQSS